MPGELLSFKNEMTRSRSPLQKRESIETKKQMEHRKKLGGEELKKYNSLINFYLITPILSITHIHHTLTVVHHVLILFHHVLILFHHLLTLFPHFR